MLISSKVFTLILFLIGLVSAGLVPDSRKSLLKGEVKCAKQCIDSKIFNYQIGRSYRYNFETKNAFTPDTGNSLNEIKITGHAKITIQSNCEHILNLENVDVVGASKDQKDKLVKELEESNLSYSFIDGKIDQVCPLSNEQKWTLNVKKAILSAIQFAPNQALNGLSTSNVEETDINGHCETTYELLSSNADQYKIIKSKKLNTCRKRINVDSALVGSSSLAADLVSLYFNSQVQSDHRCKITITKKTGVVESVKCSQSSDGPKLIQKDLRTHHEITLKFSNEEPVHYPQLTGDYYEDSLIGEKIELIDNDENKVTSGQQLKDAIQGICQTISNSTLNYQTATKFRELVNSVKHSKDDLLKIELNNLLGKRDHASNAKTHNEVMSSTTCCPHKLFKLYLEALISSKTDASLKLLVNDIVPNNFYLQEGSVRAELKLISFYTSLAFYSNPTEETLKSALPLLKLKGRHQRNALFGLTGLARTICKNDQKCDKPAIIQLVNSIADHIPANCAVKTSNENQVIESLKALENMPKLQEPVLKKITNCLYLSSVSPSVKVSAIKNFDYKTDEELVKKAVKDALMNPNEHDEVRIEAYKRFKWQITKDNAKDLEKLINQAKGELAFYIANDIQRYRDQKNVKCPKMLALLDATKDIDLKLSSQHGKSKMMISYPLSPFLKSNLALHTDLIYSSKTERPISAIITVKLHHTEILQIGLRSESGSNVLLNIANTETIVDGVMQLVKNFNSKQDDDAKSRLIDEWAAKILPELATAFREIDLYVKVGGRNLVYINKNDQQIAVGNRLDKLKLGLAPILAIEQTSDLQIHSVSGMPTVIRKDKTMLTHFMLYDSQKVSENEITFEITPNLVISQLLKVSYPIGRYQNHFKLENEQYMTTNFGLTGRKTNLKDKIEIRLKLSGQKVELLSHRIFNRIRDGNSVKEVLSNRKNRDICLENILPLKKMLGVSICSKNNEEERSIILQKTEDSNVLITLEKEKSGSTVGSKLTIEQENSPHKRKISMSMSKNAGQESSTLHFEVENPLGNGWAKINTSKDKLNVYAKLNGQKVYSLDADKSFETKGKESNFKAKVSVQFPGLNKPFTSAFTAKIINDKKFHVSGDLTVNEKARLLTYEYNAEGKFSRVKRSSDYELKNDLDIQLFNFKGQKFYHSKYDAEYGTSNAKMKQLVEYACPKKPEKLEKITQEVKLEWEKGAIEKFSIVHELESTQYPKLNFKYDQKFVYKYEFQKLLHYENDINIELHALGEGNDRKVRLGHVSTLNNFYKGSKKFSMDHLIRIVINKVNYNREISYNGNYLELIKDNIYEVNDKLKVQDISTSAEILSALVSLKAEDPSATKLKLLVDYNCNKHGKFNWAEDINYDPKTKAVSTKIVLSVSRSDQQAPSVYNGEYTANEFWYPNNFDLKLRKASDNTEVLRFKRESTKPNEKMSYVDYYGKRVYDFKLKTNNDKKLESMNLNVASVGELKLDNTNTPEGQKFTYKLKLTLMNSNYQQNAVLLHGKKVLSLDFNVTKGDNKLAQLELYLSNPKKNLVTYRDVESGSILIKAFKRQLSFKHENQQTGFSSMFELQKLDTKSKLIIMSIKDVTKFALMTKLEKDGVLKYALDSTYSMNSPSIINFKSEIINLNINVNPFGSNDDDWKVLIIDFSRKDGKYKNTSKVNIKKLPGKHALAVKSSSSGKRENDQSFEHVVDSQISSDWTNVKLNVKFNEANKVDELDYLHEFTSQGKMDFKLNHNLKLMLRNELIFQHESNTKLENADKLYKLTSESEFKAKCPYVNGVKINLKSNCNTKEKTAKVDLNLEYPHGNKVIVATYNAKNPLDIKFMRDLKVEVSNTKLNEKDLYIAKLDIIDGLEFHLKYNKQSNSGHNLENLEFRVLSKPNEYSIVVFAPRGWSGYIKLLPPNNEQYGTTSFNLNLTKRGRVLLSVDTKATIKKRDSKKRAISWPHDEITIHTVTGFNGNPKFTEETVEISNDEYKYKFTSVFFNIDANLKGMNADKKKLYIKACSAKQVTNCAVLDANIERSNKVAKSQGSFKYGFGEEAVTIAFDYNRQKLDNGNNEGKITGDINGNKFVGEALVKKNGEMNVKINLPERVIQYTKELTSNGFKYTLYPNLNKDKSHVHSLTIATARNGKRKSVKLEMLHPSFKRPLKIDAEFEDTKYAKIVLDIANDEKKKLTFEAHRYIDTEKVTSSFIFYREDRKIDFGETKETQIIKSKGKYKNTFNIKRHWVNKEGKNLTYVRTEDTYIEGDENAFDVTSKILNDVINDYALVEGKMHLDLKKHAMNGVYNWVFGVDKKDKKRTEFDYKNKCMKFEQYDLPKESYKNNHLINLCAVGKLSDQDLFKFEYIRPEFNAKKKLTNNEKLLLQLSNADDNQLRAVMHWDPEMIGEWIVDGGEYIEKQQKEKSDMLVQIQSEVEDKFNLLKDSLMNDLVIPMRKHRQDEFNQILKEINPKLAAKLRSKRAAIKVSKKNDTEEASFLAFSESLGKKLFDFKLVKFSPEEGQVEFLFRPHPTFEGIKYSIKNSFQYLLKE